jgi:hypothetical protein
MALMHVHPTSKLYSQGLGCACVYILDDAPRVAAGLLAKKLDTFGQK